MSDNNKRRASLILILTVSILTGCTTFQERMTRGRTNQINQYQNQIYNLHRACKNGHITPNEYYERAAEIQALADQYVARESARKQQAVNTLIGVMQSNAQMQQQQQAFQTLQAQQAIQQTYRDFGRSRSRTTTGTISKSYLGNHYDVRLRTY